MLNIGPKPPGLQGFMLFASATKKKSFIGLTKGVISFKLLTVVINKKVLKASSALITDSHFYPSLIFVGRARSLQLERSP